MGSLVPSASVFVCSLQWFVCVSFLRSLEHFIGLSASVDHKALSSWWSRHIPSSVIVTLLVQFLSSDNFL
jgi:hypothetical protein